MSWLLLIGVGAPSTDPWLSSVVTNQIANDSVVGLLFAVNMAPKFGGKHDLRATRA